MIPDYPVSLIIYFGVIGDYIDLIEAKKNLESLHQDKEKLQSLFFQLAEST